MNNAINARNLPAEVPDLLTGASVVAPWQKIARRAGLERRLQKIKKERKKT